MRDIGLNDQLEYFLSAYKNQCLNKGMLDNSDLKGTLVYFLSDMSNSPYAKQTLS